MFALPQEVSDLPQKCAICLRTVLFASKTSYLPHQCLTSLRNLNQKCFVSLRKVLISLRNVKFSLRNVKFYLRNVLFPSEKSLYSAIPPPKWRLPTGGGGSGARPSPFPSGNIYLKHFFIPSNIYTFFLLQFCKISGFRAVSPCSLSLGNTDPSHNTGSPLKKTLHF